MWSWPVVRNNVRIKYAVVSACVPIVETRTKIEGLFKKQVCLLRESRVSSDFIYTVYPVLDTDDFDFLYAGQIWMHHFYDQNILTLLL